MEEKSFCNCACFTVDVNVNVAALSDGGECHLGNFRTSSALWPTDSSWSTF